MPIQVGSLVEYTGRLHTGSVFRVAELLNQYQFRDHNGDRRTLSLVQEFVPRAGIRVFCIDPPSNMWRRNQVYTIAGFNAELNRYLINGYWVAARRFRILLDREAAPVVAPRPPPPVVPYQLHPFPGCCGSQIIYFDNRAEINEDRLRRTLERLLVPSAHAILNHAQRGNRELLERFGFKYCGASASNSGAERPLYHFIYVKRPALEKEVAEKARSFG